MSLSFVALRLRPRAGAGLLAASSFAAWMAMALPSAAHAGGGVLEIDQTCAVRTGCFAGDAAGFPVTIGTLAGARSFRLTSDLTLASLATNAITISVSDVRLDLAGFSIRGPVVCSGTPIACVPSTGSGVGVESSGTFNGVEVLGGSVVGMGVGVSLGNGATIRNLRARSNRLEGIKMLADGRIARVIAYRNGNTGISIASGLVERSIAQENGKVGIFSSSGRTEIRDCAVRGNEDTGIGGNGVARVVGNVVTNNGLDGISVGAGSLVEGNVSSVNQADGIAASGATSVVDNLVRANNGFGLAFTGTGNAYRGNTLNDDVSGTVFGAASAANQGANACNGAPTCP